MEDYKRLNRELKYHGAILDMYADTILAPNGNVVTWDFIHHEGAAAVLPVADDGKILMIRQYRNALDRETLEIPAGKLDSPQETKRECAARELEEETGYRSDCLAYLLSVNTTVAFCDEEIEVYVAKNLQPARQHLDENEFVAVEAYELDDLCRMIREGKIKDSKTVAGLLAYRLMRENGETEP